MKKKQNNDPEKMNKINQVCNLRCASLMVHELVIFYVPRWTPLLMSLLKKYTLQWPHSFYSKIIVDFCMDNYDLGNESTIGHLVSFLGAQVAPLRLQLWLRLIMCRRCFDRGLEFSLCDGGVGQQRPAERRHCCALLLVCCDLHMKGPLATLLPSQPTRLRKADFAVES